MICSSQNVVVSLYANIYDEDPYTMIHKLFMEFIDHNLNCKHLFKYNEHRQFWSSKMQLTS
jgi:hypothetical protein